MEVSGYFDTASIGLVPDAVRTAVSACYEALGSGVRGSRQWRPVVECAHARYADEFQVSESEIAFMPSTGDTINAIAQSVPWSKGDEVLVLSDEFPTVVLPWRGVTARIKVVEVDPLPGDDRLGALVAGIGPRTRVVAVSHVSSFTGTCVDLRVLGVACRQAGALLVVDGAQAAGAVPVDLHDVDFYIATGYKWLLAGFGAAVVVGKKPALESLRPFPLWHGGAPPGPRLAFGHLNLAGVYALDAAIAFRRSRGTDAIRHRVSTLALRIRQEAEELGLRPQAAPERTAGIVSLAGVDDVPGAVERLAALGIAVAARGGLLRISPHFYVTDLDVDRLIGALKNF